MKRRTALGMQMVEYSYSRFNASTVQPPFCFCASRSTSSLLAADGGCAGHFFRAIAVVANDADANEPSIEAVGEGARHSWRLPGDLLVASSKLTASPILMPSSKRSSSSFRRVRGEFRSAPLACSRRISRAARPAASSASNRARKSVSHAHLDPIAVPPHSLFTTETSCMLFTVMLRQASRSLACRTRPLSSSALRKLLKLFTDLRSLKMPRLCESVDAICFGSGPSCGCADASFATYCRILYNFSRKSVLAWREDAYSASLGACKRELAMTHDDVAKRARLKHAF